MKGNAISLQMHVLHEKVRYSFAFTYFDDRNVFLSVDSVARLGRRNSTLKLCDLQHAISAALSVRCSRRSPLRCQWAVELRAVLVLTGGAGSLAVSAQRSSQLQSFGPNGCNERQHSSDKDHFSSQVHLPSDGVDSWVGKWKSVSPKIRICDRQAGWP